MNDARAKYITVDAFRREYFDVGSRPTRANVRSWIDDGRLRGVCIDGRVYVRRDHAEAFLDGAAIQERVDERLKERVKDWRERQESAKKNLRAFGFDV